MMRLRSVVRDVALVCVAVAVGWWVRGGDRAVLAQPSNSSEGRGGSAGSNSPMAFQFIGTGPGTALALYNPANRTLYLYDRIGLGNASLSCSYSYTIATPGASVRRDNCPMGELAPGH